MFQYFELIFSVFMFNKNLQINHVHAYSKKDL